MRNAALLVVLAFAAPAAAQPAKKHDPSPAAPTEDDVSFDKELDALISKAGLTSDQAAHRAAGASPAVRRRAAEIEVAIAQLKAAELARVPITSAKASYTRLSPLDPLMFGP